MNKKSYTLKWSYLHQCQNIKGYKVFSIFVTEHKTVVYTSNTAMK